MKFVIESIVGCLLWGGFLTVSDYLRDVQVDQGSIGSNLLWGLLFGITMAIVDPQVRKWVEKVNGRKAKG